MMIYVVIALLIVLFIMVVENTMLEKELKSQIAFSFNVEMLYLAKLRKLRQELSSITGENS